MIESHETARDFSNFKKRTVSKAMASEICVVNIILSGVGNGSDTNIATLYLYLIP